MSGFVAVLLLAALSWLMRLAFILLIPASRLAARIRSTALNQLPAAVLAALVSIQLVDTVPGGARGSGPTSLVALVGIGVIARRWPSPALSTGLGVVAVLCIDLVVF